MTMRYFQNITSLAGLKKQYRTLAKEHHPDRGGSTETMQVINREFEVLYKKWEHDTSTPDSTTGYENDHAGTTAREYASRVYNEYRWTGSRYKGQHAPEIAELVRKWLKEAYPDYTFSLTRIHYNSICIRLMKADFEAFVSGGKYKASAQLNHYHLDKDENLTDRARDVMTNVRDYALSYNFDDSDSMTDYYHTNFYLDLGIGSDRQPYKIEIPKSRRTKGDAPPQFRHPEGAAHKAIRQALGQAHFGSYDSHRHGAIIALGENHTWHNGEVHFYPLNYSSAKTAQKRIDKLAAAGIICRLTGHNRGYIRFLGYSPETEAAMQRERQEYTDALAAWKLEQAG
jgi:hypothetical protein